MRELTLTQAFLFVISVLVLFVGSIVAAIAGSRALGRVRRRPWPEFAVASWLTLFKWPYLLMWVLFAAAIALIWIGRMLG